MNKRPLGVQISQLLKDRGVKVIFGIPGVHNQELYRGIEDAGLRHVLARHEQGVGFMADGYARATGTPGICYVISGPGLCNIMTPMGQAYSDSVPMLVISSCLDDTENTQDQLHQMLDQEGAAACVCDWSKTAQSAEDAYALIDRALVEFSSKRPRPKHIQVPIALLQSEVSSAKTPDFPIIPAVGNDLDFTNLAAELATAKRPLFILGGGCVHAAGAALDQVLERSGAAVFTTYAGRGIVSEDYPLGFGAYLPRAQSARVCAKADLIVAVGTTLAEVDLWRDSLGHTGRLVRIDIDNTVLIDRVQAEKTYLADAQCAFAGLLPYLPQTGQSDWSEQEVAAYKRCWRSEIDAEHSGIVPVADALRAALPEDVMIFSDMTQFAYAAKEIWPMQQPGHWHHPYGFGTLGYALPAAIGGKIGLPEKPIIAIAGDYGFQYTLQELAVAVELGLSLPIIVWDNGKLGAIEDSMVRAQIAPNAVVQSNPDFCKLAEAYGALAVQPADLAQLQSAVQVALNAGKPTLIHLNADIAKG